MWKGLTSMTTPELTRAELQAEELVVLPERLETTRWGGHDWNGWDGWNDWNGWDDWDDWDDWDGWDGWDGW